MNGYMIYILTPIKCCLCKNITYVFLIYFFPSNTYVVLEMERFCYLLIPETPAIKYVMHSHVQTTFHGPEKDALKL